MPRLRWARCLSLPLAGPDADAPEGDPTPQDTPPPAGGASDAGQDPAAEKRVFDETYVKKLRAEAASHRKEKTELEARLKEIEDSRLTDEQKKAKERQDLQDELNHLRYKARLGELIDAAVKAGAAKPSLVARLIEDGEEADEAVARLKKENPELFRAATAGSADGGNQGKAGGQPSMNDLIRGALNRTVIQP